MLGLVLASHNSSKRFNIIMPPNISEGLFVIEAKTIADFFFLIVLSLDKSLVTKEKKINTITSCALDTQKYETLCGVSH